MFSIEKDECTGPFRFTRSYCIILLLLSPLFRSKIKLFETEAALCEKVIYAPRNPRSAQLQQFSLTR